MSRFNRKVEYALMALRRLSAKPAGALTTAKEVSDAHRTPFDATARVMQIMASRGLLRSEHGASGGYVLEKDLREISVLQLIEMIEGPQGLVKCAHKDGDDCEILQTCNIVQPLSNLNQRLQDFYASINLQELLMSEASNSSSPEVSNG